MKYLFLLLSVLFLIGCEGDTNPALDRITIELGQEVYYPDLVLIGAPDSMSFRHASIIDNQLKAPFWYNLVIVNYVSGKYSLSNSILGGPEFYFQMYLTGNGFELVDRHGAKTVYRK